MTSLLWLWVAGGVTRLIRREPRRVLLTAWCQETSAAGSLGHSRAPPARSSLEQADRRRGRRGVELPRDAAGVGGKPAGLYGQLHGSGHADGVRRARDGGVHQDA